jgi:hypothetical protein
MLFIIRQLKGHDGVWLSHRAKTMKGINNYIAWMKSSKRDIFTDEWNYFVVESDSGVHAKKVIKYMNFGTNTSVYGRIIMRIN